MKRTLFIASIIGLFLFTGLDLQARHRRKGLPGIVRGGIAVALLGHMAMHNQHTGYGRYQNHQTRQIVREIRSNEKRIWKLEKRLNRLERRYGNPREMRRLEEEIYWLERRNDYLRNRLY